MDKETLNVIGAIALNDIFGQEPQLARNIISALGSTCALFELSSKELFTLFGPGSRFRGRVSRDCLDAAAETYEKLSSQGCSFVCIGDEAYPKLLLECPDAPVLLYIRGSTPPGLLFNRRPSVAIVGTRDVSAYGKDWCARIVAALAETGSPPVIVSGLAIGVDITAHLAALEHSLPTIGVSPVGIDDIYPRRHALIAGRMAASPESAVVTDYPPGTLPMPHVFLRRNRIIAGLSDATVLIESKVRGGGMMTARLAAGYGRSVYVLPGRIDDIRSSGCNRLLAEKIAEPVTSPEALAEALGLGNIRRKRSRPDEIIRRTFSGNVPEADIECLIRLHALVRRRPGVSYDELCTLTGFPYPEIARLAGLLESAGLVRTDMLQRCTTNPDFV